MYVFLLMNKLYKFFGMYRVFLNMIFRVLSCIIFPFIIAFSFYKLLKSAVHEQTYQMNIMPWPGFIDW